jgi:hypothetical protein
MKKVALTVAVLALGLAACETKTENAADNAATENVVETDANAAMTVDNALDAAGNEVTNAGDAIENAGDAVANAAENAAQ